jgi:Tfp pilus assembly protein PilO
MKGSDKAIVMGVIVAIVLGVFYVKVLSPKREKASVLQKDITELQASVDQQNQAAAFGEDARRHFATYYGRLVVMGKAVPADGDTASLLVQLNGIANHNDVRFEGLTIDDSTGATDPSASATPPPADPSAAAASSGTSTTSTTPSSTPSATTPASTTIPTAATEATAASLPLGAAVGAAGLPTMPYKLTFYGHYFDVADFLKGVDDLVHVNGTDQVSADGRLLTINGFAMKPPDGDTSANPKLKVNLVVTSYVTPSDQGLTVGASPTGPAPSLTQPPTQPASATVSP